jgi:hypothetical protein
VGLLAACLGQRAVPPSADIDETGFRNAIRVLASDEFEGRKPGTPGEDKTVAFLVEQFKKLGLKPGNGDSFLQQVPLVEIRAGDDASLTISGRGSAQPLAYAKDMVIWTQRVAPDAAVQQSDLVFVGYGIVAPEFEWNDYAGVDVHGKTVVVLVNDPGYGFGNLLRALDLQAGGGGTAWGRRRAVDPRYGSGGVRLERGGERPHRAAAGAGGAR